MGRLTITMDDTTQVEITRKGKRFELWISKRERFDPPLGTGRTFGKWESECNITGDAEAMAELFQSLFEFIAGEVGPVGR